MNNQDPTLDEMREHLRSIGQYPAGDVSTAEEVGEFYAGEAAIYWFAVDYYGGQWSNLYAALCASPYHPGPVSTLETEGEEVAELVAELVAQFAS